MSWRDRDDDDPFRRLGRPGGDWQGVRPRLDNPMSWAVPLGRAGGIVVRLHIAFILYAVVQLARSLGTPHVDSLPRDFTLVAAEMACLFIVVLLHEFGHCLTCRRVGGEANEILMWPLGGLAFCRPPGTWKAHLATAVGGPAVNVAIIAVAAPVLGLVTGQWLGVAFPNPFVLDISLVALPDGTGPWWLLILFFLNDISVVLLLFNLLPIFPLDGGRICQTMLWPRFGYVRSMQLAVYTGYFGAIGLFVVGAVISNWMLMGIAVFGGITCYVTIKQLEWTESFMVEDDLYAASQWSGEVDEEDEGVEMARVDAQAERRDRELAEEAEHVDRILAKIGEQGLDSLSPRERKVLKRATDRRRQEGDPSE